MKQVSKMDELPSSVLDEVRRLYLEDGEGALRVSKVIESNFGYKLPPLHTVDTYLKSLDTKSPSSNPSSSISDTQSSQQLSTGNILDSLSGIDTSSLKNQNSSLKEFIKAKIETLQAKSLNQEFDKDVENLIQRYAVELSKLTLNEVKIKDEFKDTEKVSLSDVKFYLNKIMSCVRMCINQHAPELVDNIFKDLKIQLDYVFNDIIDPHIYGSQKSIDEEQKILKEKQNEIR